LAPDPAQVIAVEKVRFAIFAQRKDQGRAQPNPPTY
jgi:hypothetical protein